MPRGNPNCELCHGKGGYRMAYGWRPCKCTQMTKAVRDAMRTFNSSGAKRSGDVRSLFDEYDERG